jgi:hypothetical protein
MGASPEYLAAIAERDQAIVERDAALAQRDAALAQRDAVWLALEGFLRELTELVRRHDPTIADQSPPPEPPPSTEAPEGRVFGKARR